ncbi:MAG: ribosome maturation factor RimM, partial [Acidimicrobiales bacterium]
RPSPPDELEVVEARPHQGRHIVVFEGVSSIDAAEPLRDVLLSAPPLDDPDALFVHELIGRAVVDAGGVLRGTVTAVEANPASDLLVLDERHYVPLRFVVRADADGIVVDVPDGLFD